jgi:hypothetical protein
MSGRFCVRFARKRRSPPGSSPSAAPRRSAPRARSRAARARRRRAPRGGAPPRWRRRRTRGWRSRAARDLAAVAVHRDDRDHDAVARDLAPVAQHREIDPVERPVDEHLADGHAVDRGQSSSVSASDRRNREQDACRRKPAAPADRRVGGELRYSPWIGSRNFGRRRWMSRASSSRRGCPETWIGASCAVTTVAPPQQVVDHPADALVVSRDRPREWRTRSPSEITTSGACRPRCARARGRLALRAGDQEQRALRGQVHRGFGADHGSRRDAKQPRLAATSVWNSIDDPTIATFRPWRRRHRSPAGAGGCCSRTS